MVNNHQRTIDNDRLPGSHPFSHGQEDIEEEEATKTCEMDESEEQVRFFPSNPKDPDMSWERDFPYNLTMGIGIETINPTRSGRGLDS